jgi:uncharacterized protein YjbI with pentapeptide repeats
MADDKENPESGAGRWAAPLKIKAEDNPWYLLATLYDNPGKVGDFDLRNKNRLAWNRYFAANLDNETRTRLIADKRHTAEELTPFAPEALEQVKAAFEERSRWSRNKFTLPASGSYIDFSNVEFQNALFDGYLFGTELTFFDGATFSGYASFNGATFSGYAFFRDATFSGGAFFNGATFSGGANFGGAAFYVASFEGATFSGVAEFYRAKFSDVAKFVRATFSRGAIFKNATFNYAIFKSAIFLDGAKFADATFQGLSLFVNAKMKGVTSFENATFETEPPLFSGAKLHQGTVWRGITWPPPPKNTVEAGRFLDAYACLKLEMNRLQKHEDELDFFALELQSRCVLLGPWRGLPIWLYGVLSDYGRSYARPFLWLLVVAAIGAVLLVFSDALPIEKSFDLSFANTFNVFGFRKDFFDSHYIENLPAALKILAAIQTILGVILLFLFGLGVRNKFRMK